ncbi:alpha/beta hydrolase family protein [Streptomyces sp. NPDC005780]|uniref:alpha/beta hydrolase family protein n=1 Tax=Streptomyces sp. NPDC005780 TaxID=3364730 RepID=UPI0036900FD5
MREISRRSVLSAAGAAGLVLTTAGLAHAVGRVPGSAPAAGTEPAAGSRKGRVRLTVPAPTGPWRIGTTSLHLIDRSRRDQWISPASPRELMVSMWYPTSDTHGCRRAPWLPPAATEMYRRQAAQNLRTPLDNVDFPVTHAWQDAPVAARRHGHPVVLFSPGYNTMRAMGTALVEDLAGHGYLVVTIDHTHEASIVEFPDGRVERGRNPEELSALQVRQEDTRFVLNELEQLNAGRNPDAEGRRLPHCLRGSLDLSRIGMFGHSIGGDTAAGTMAQDRRILAGVDLDGSINGTVAATGLDRPFLLMGNSTHGRYNDPSWADFWSHLRGWRLELRLRHSAHHTYTDMSPLAQQLERALSLPPEVVAALTGSIGTIDADRAVAGQRAYLRAFFDLHLRGGDGHLLSRPSRRYPDIEFVR